MCHETAKYCNGAEFFTQGVSEVSERVGIVGRCFLLSLISSCPADLIFPSGLHSYNKSCIRRFHWGYWSPFFLLLSPSVAHFPHWFNLPGHIISLLQQISYASTCSWGWWVVLRVAGKGREHGPVPQLELRWWDLHWSGTNGGIVKQP